MYPFSGVLLLEYWGQLLVFAALMKLKSSTTWRGAEPGLGLEKGGLGGGNNTLAALLLFV